MNDSGRNPLLTLSVGLSDVTVPADVANYNVIEASYFCTRANIQSSVVYLSQELQSMGINRRIVESGGTSVNLIALINACWECLQLYHAAVRDGDLLQDQRRKDNADLHHLQSSIRGLKGSVEEKERLVCDAQEKERQTSTINKSLATKLKAEKEEVRRLSSVMQQREAQCQHELRKKENENSKLRDRLHRLLSSDRSVGTKASGLVMTASLTRADKARGKWKTEATGVRHEEELHRRVLAQYEGWVGQLSAENDLLKSVLSVFSSQVSKMSSKLTKENQLPQDIDMNTSLTSSTFSADSLEDPMFSLDFKTVSEQVQSTLEENMKAISSALEEKKEKERKEDEDLRVLQEKINEMNIKLAKANDQINSYKVITEKNLPSEGELTFLVDGGCVEERAVIEKEREALTEERKSMQLEREKFTDAVIRLNRERALFESEKVELLRQQFLQELPTSLNDSITSGHESGESLSNCSFANEMFNDSPNRLLAIPCVTSPQGNITAARNAQPVLLGPAHIPQQSRIPPCYSSLHQERAVPRNPKTVRPRPSLPSHLISAPGSLSSSRRSSQDGSTVEELLKSRQAFVHRMSPKQGENE
ncbi:afadin- and alpha-actinin-binding protein-like isoform X3 [Oratosquilla oratoria]|uniref:afadin- and alpha-actinin-binding protein-like isoform X3 n=1 Tax=Oratosquilla oratoria TaxID=337810 RepID=UPI003F767F99